MDNEKNSNKGGIHISGGSTTVEGNMIGGDVVINKDSSVFEEAQFQLALKLIRLSSEFRNAYGAVRSFYVYESETASRPHGENESNAETALLDERYARLNRIRRVSDAAHALWELIPEAEVILQPDIAKFIEPYTQEHVQLFDAIFYYFSAELALTKREINHLDDPERHAEYLRRLRAPHPRAAYNGEIDEAGKCVDELTKRLRQELEKYLRRSIAK